MMNDTTQVAPSTAPARPHPETTAEGALILAIDARPHSREALAATLRADGHRVLAANNVNGALQVLARERPAAALVHRAGLGSGLRHLRAAAPGLPVILYGPSAPGSAPTADTDGGVAEVEDEAPGRLREALACTLMAARCVERLRHEQELRSLALVQLCHTLRAPLDVIQGYTDVLRENPAAPDAQLLLDGLTCAVANAMKLTREHLALASIDGANVAVRREPVEVDALLDDLRRAAARQLGGRRLRLVASTDFRGAVVFTDGDKLRALLAQLLIRAAESSPRGVLRLRVAAAADTTVFELVDRPTAASRAPLCSPEALGDALDGDQGNLQLVQRLAALLGAQIGTRRTPSGANAFVVCLRTPLTLPPDQAAWGTVH
jgi:signal transduction histidine kinase